MTILEPNVSCFKELAKQEFGLDFYNKNEQQLLKAIDKRSKLHGYGLYQDYYEFLNDNREELLELVCLLTNNETYFYREPKQLAFLCEFLVPKIQTEITLMKPIRILSIGCSIGAEPYSIAMALKQKYGNAAKYMFDILAADVDSRALKVAKAGNYRSMEFRSIPPHLQQQYFSQEKNGDFTLAEEIREMVSFHHLNVVSDNVANQLKNIDIVFFRNVSIYFDQSTRQAIQKKIITLLKPKGYLLVGMTESMSNDFGLLNLKHQGDVFYFVKDESPSKLEQSPIKAQELKKKEIPANQVHDKAVKISLPETLIQINHKNETLVAKDGYDKALKMLDNLSSDSTSTSQYFLLKSFILYHQKDYEHSRDYALRVLDIEPFTIDGFLLLGLISKCQGHTDDAIDWFKKALFIHADCWLARYNLAGLYRQTQNSQKAVKEYKQVLQQLQIPNENYIGVLSIPLSYNRDYIQALCHSHLLRLDSLN